MVEQANFTGGLATLAVINEKVRNLPKYYGKVQCSHDNPMIQLKEVEKILAELESNMLSN